MDSADSKTVTDTEGICGRVVSASPDVRSTAAYMVVQLDNGPQVLVPTHLLIPQPDGSYVLPCCLAELEPAGSEHRVHQDEPLVIPVVVEELEVQKQVVETGKVRLTKVVHERETLVDEPLWRENVTITRVPMERVVEGPVPVREEEGTTILSVVEEVLVVEKRWMLREEIHIRQERRETHQPQRITLRSEEVQIERVPHADADT
jgi:Uncharacterized protein conserved in bacteria